MAWLPARHLEVKTTMSTERKISGLIFQSRASFTCGPTSATTPPLDGAPEQLTQCSGFMTALERSLLPTMTRLPSTLAATLLLQQFASPCPLASIESVLASAAATQRPTVLVATTTT
jgi:hypothetical protein